MDALPSTLIPYFVGSLVFAIFCWRAFTNYRRLHNPLSLYFGYISLFVSLAFGSWTIPLFFSHDIEVVKLINIIGDLFLYAFYVACAALVYYLALQNRIKKSLFMIPVIILAISGWLTHVYGYQHYGVTIDSKEVSYNLPTASSVIQLLLLVNIFLVGILVLRRLSTQTTNRGRMGMVGISMLFILSGLAGTLNVIMADGYSNSPVILGSYLVAFVFFVAVLVLARFSKSSTK